MHLAYISPISRLHLPCISPISRRSPQAAGLPSGALRVARVLATEQPLVSHTYGLKGTVDVVLAAEVLDPHGTPTHQVPVPLELGLGLGLPKL